MGRAVIERGKKVGKKVTGKKIEEKGDDHQI